MTAFCWPPIAAGGGSSGNTSSGLETSGAPVDVSGAAPPVAGQVLTATDATHAAWRVPGLKYDAAIRFNLGASSTASIEPGTWGLANELPVGSDDGFISIVSSLSAPPVDSRFAVYVARTVTAVIHVEVVGAASIQALDGTLHTSIVAPAGAFLEWVLYHDPDLGAVWGLVSDTAGVAKRFSAPWVASDITFAFEPPLTTPGSGAALTYLDDGLGNRSATWDLPAVSIADTVESALPVDFVLTANHSLNGNSGVYDGVTVANDYLVLLTGQTITTENGFWQTHDGPWERAIDYPEPPELPFMSGLGAYVRSGDTYGGTLWVHIVNNQWRAISVGRGAHAATHGRGGNDIVAAAQLSESSGPTTLAIGAIAAGQFLQRSGATIVGATPSTAAHASTHARGGSDIVIASKLSESAGPTTLDINAIADGQFLLRSGTTIVGGSPSGVAIAAAISNIYTDTPASVDASWSDEFDSGSADLAARGWTVQGGLATTFTRVGDILPYTPASSLAANTYRSTIRNSRLLLQTSAPMVIWKASSGAFFYSMAVRGGAIDNANVAYVFIGDTQLQNQNGERIIVGYFNNTLDITRHSGGSALPVTQDNTMNKIYDELVCSLDWNQSTTTHTSAIHGKNSHRVLLKAAPTSNGISSYNKAGLQVGAAATTTRDFIEIDYIRRQPQGGWFAF